MEDKDQKKHHLGNLVGMQVIRSSPDLPQQNLWGRGRGGAVRNLDACRLSA